MESPIKYWQKKDETEVTVGEKTFNQNSWLSEKKCIFPLLKVQLFLFFPEVIVKLCGAVFTVYFKP